MSCTAEHLPGKTVRCFECFRRELRARSERLEQVTRPIPLRSPSPVELSARQIAHRRAMLANLERQR